MFVFAITQVVSLIVHDLTWDGLFEAAIILGILWWGWTNWTWVTNLVSLEPRQRRLIVLAGMIGVFIMAHAVPTAFEGSGMWVAVPYILMSTLSTVLMWDGIRVSRDNTEGFWRYTPLALASGAFLVAGALIDDLQVWFWLGALLINVTAATLGAGSEWMIDAKHFAERHGLIMIIALGEAIIVVGSSLSGEVPSAEIAQYLVVGLALAMTLYWAYFDRAQEIWEGALRRASSGTTGLMARDVYSFTHFPMIVGIVFSAVALEEAFLHPDDPLETMARWALVIGVGSFLGGVVYATYRSIEIFLMGLVLGVPAVTLVTFAATTLAGPTTVVVVTGLLLASMIVEYARHPSKRRHSESVDA